MPDLAAFAPFAAIGGGARLARALALLLTTGAAAAAQTPPSAAEIAAYTGLHAAAHAGDVETIRRLVAKGADVNARDAARRTPAHVAAFAGRLSALQALARSGADMNAFDGQSYDVLTIAAVADNVPMVRLALELGDNPSLVTSPWRGTALIAAAHLGHADVVRLLAKAGAPLDHINSLGWTALIEAVVLGNGGPAHQATVAALLAAGADPGIPDRDGATPLALAERRGYTEIVILLRQAGAR
jgi:ankyrin repeat protein